MSTILQPPSGEFFQSGDRFENNLGRKLTINEVAGDMITYTYDVDDFYTAPHSGARRCSSTIGWRKL